MTNSRRKGADGERELAKLLAERLGIQPRRNLDQWRDGGFDLQDIPCFAIEVKRLKCDSRGNHDKWFKQAEDQAEGTGLVPVVAYREDRRRWRFIMPLSWRSVWVKADISLSDFCRVARRVIEYEQQRHQSVRKQCRRRVHHHLV